MDFIFDSKNKNWPTETQGRLPLNHLIVTMGEYGFKAVTTGTGFGKATVSGKNYLIQLPGTVEDGKQFVVRFALLEE